MNAQSDTMQFSEIKPDDIVISGISGQVPNCANLNVLRQSLLNKQELLTPTKNYWPKGYSEVPPTMGKVHEWNKFDAEFFGFDLKEAQFHMDPQVGRVIENAYEAINDAGIQPSTLRGSNTLVATGISKCDAESVFVYGESPEALQVQRRFQSTNFMIPAFVSSLLGFTGPTFCTDTACSSFLYAFSKAYEEMRRGICDKALVCCSNTLFCAATMVQFFRLGVLTRTEHCRPMDASGDGYVRSETSGAVFLQRARDAKRIYAVVAHAETNSDGFKEENITYPSRSSQAQLMRSVYSKPCVNIQAVTYMELHATGTKVGDPVELAAVDDVFFSEGQRKKSLLVGSIKSNLGHAEAASGFCSLAKVLITMQMGLIPPTINFTFPREEITSLHNGHLQVVTETTPWQPGLVAINNFGFGGANAHVVLRPGPQRRTKSASWDSVPRLVVASGRTEEAALALVQLAAAGSEGAGVDVELVRLLHELSATPTPGHPYRAFGLAPVPANYIPVARRCGDARPPVWLALAEKGACWGDWAAVGAALLRLPAFAAALRRRDAPLDDAGAVKEAILDVLWVAGLRPQETICMEKIGEGTLPEEVVVLLVAASGEATRVAREALRVRGDEERVLALFGDANDSDPLLEFLCNIGRLYCNGVNIKTSALYEDIKLPVSLETPMIAPHVLWDYSKVSLQNQVRYGINDRYVDTHLVDLTNFTCKFMGGHVIDDRILLPATGYIKCVWETFAQSLTQEINSTPVVFEDIRFLRATHLTKDFGQVQLLVTIHRISGAFELSEGSSAVVTGYVRPMTDQDRSQMLPPAEPWDPSGDAASPHMTPRDVYKALRLRGYNYSGLFRGIAAASCDGRRGLLRWDDNWVTFLDCMMQLQLLPDASGTLAVPTALQKLCIDVTNHTPHLHEYGSDQVVAAASVDAVSRSVRAGGVELRGLRANVIARRKPAGDPVLERYDFAPYRLDEEGEGAEDGEEVWEEAVGVCAQIALENRGPISRGAASLSTLEVLTGKAKRPLAPLLLAALGDMPLVQVRLMSFLEEGVKEEMKDALRAHDSEEVTDIKTLAEKSDVAFVIGSGMVAWGSLSLVTQALGPTGCVVTLEEAGNLRHFEEEKVRNTGLRLLLSWRRGQHSLLLLRKGGWEVDARHATVVHIREEAGEAFGWLPTLQAALREARRPEQRVLLVAEGQPLSGVQGLFNCLRQEPGPGRDKLRLYVLERGAEPFSLQSEMYRKQLELDVAVNILRDGQWGAMRHFLLPAASETGQVLLASSRCKGAVHAYCDAATMGDLSSFTWFEGDLDVSRAANIPGHELTHVYYSAVNFRDVMLASGKLNAASVPASPGQKCLIGFEVAGRTTSGRRVMGITAEGGGIGTLLSTRKYFLWDVPEHWSLEEAATVPAVYFTAVYALMRRGRMRRGESVLVHAGSGGVGQAAIHLALAQGCRVLATAGTDEKRRFLLRTFPQLAPEDVGNSRDASFEALVLRRTAGRGVDLVLNSLAGDKLLASLRCLAPGGRFLEIGKFDMEKNTNLLYRLLTEGRSFHGILLDKYWIDTPQQVQEELANYVKHLTKQGVIRPLHAHVFERENVEEAFRFMASGKHIGKVLIRIRPEEDQKSTIPSPLAIKARRRFHCLPDRSYVICGGLGGFGLELVDWLVSRGCKNLVLTSRRGVSNGYQARKMLLWERKGVRVHVFTGDAATHAGADALLRAANALAPLAAIFNLAVVLRDAHFDNQTADAFVESYRCKALATRRLDAASRRLCPRLTHFVVFSSVSCGRGNAGQTNYGLANSVMEGVVRARREAGLPGTAVQWGAVGDVGLVADMRDDDRQLEIGGTLQQRLSSCLEVLDGFLAEGRDENTDSSVLSSMVVAEKKAGGHGEDIVSLVADTFGIKDVRTVSPESTLAELGLDSMMAVEIQQALERNFGISLTVQELRALSFARLSEMQKELKETGESCKTQESLPEKEVSWKSAAFPWEKLLPLARGLLTVNEGVSLKTLGSNTCTGEELIMLPGAEDAAEILQPLVARLQCPAQCLQMGGFTDRCSLGEMVDYLMPVVKNHLQGQDTFRLLGYSFGGLLALEIAARLEEAGLRGRLVLLDSSPDFMRAMLLAQFKGEFNDVKDIPVATFEINTATSVLAVLEDKSTEESSALLAAYSNWEQQLSRVLQQAETYGIPTQTLIMCIEKTLARGLAVREYSWLAGRPPLASPVALVRPSRSPYPVHDYGLSQICKLPVCVQCVEAVDHNTIVAHSRTADIINDFLKERYNK